jgi:NAD+ kinase
MLLTPIAPHMLTNRPLVVAGFSEVSVSPDMDGQDDEVFVTFDGQSGHVLQRGDVIAIRRAQHPLRLVRSPLRSYFDVLRQKLKWGER